MNILYLSAPAGAQKTQAIIDTASRNAREGHKTLIVQPTILLLQKTEERLRQHDSTALVSSIHSGKIAGSGIAISNHLATTHQDGEILFICQEGFDQLQGFPRRDEWNVVFDEVPKLDIRHEYNVPKSHRIVTDFLCLAGSEGRYSRLKPKDPTTLKAIALNRRGDEVWVRFQPLARCLCSDGWETYVLTESFEKLLANRNEKLTAYSVRKPCSLSGFKSVTFAGALFEDSLLYNAWKAQGIEFVEDQELNSKLAFREHVNGHLLTIKYALQGQWSKNRRDQAGIEKAVIDAFCKGLGDQPFLWQHNKDREHRHPFGNKENAKKLPYVPHGLNEYLDLHNVAVLSAYHLSPDHRTFHKEMWSLTDTQITVATHLMAIYQAVMRSSLRDPENKDRKTILLPDRNTAQSMSLIFPGSQLSCLDVDPTSVEAPKKRGRPPKYDGSDAQRLRQRVQASRERKKLKEMELG